MNCVNSVILTAKQSAENKTPSEGNNNSVKQNTFEKVFMNSVDKEKPSLKKANPEPEYGMPKEDKELSKAENVDSHSDPYIFFNFFTSKTDEPMFSEYKGDICADNSKIEDSIKAVEENSGILLTDVGEAGKTAGQDLVGNLIESSNGAKCVTEEKKFSILKELGENNTLNVDSVKENQANSSVEPNEKSNDGSLQNQPLNTTKQKDDLNVNKAKGKFSEFEKLLNSKTDDFDKAVLKVKNKTAETTNALSEITGNGKSTVQEQKTKMKADGETAQTVSQNLITQAEPKNKKAEGRGTETEFDSLTQKTPVLGNVNYKNYKDVELNITPTVSAGKSEIEQKVFQQVYDGIKLNLKENTKEKFSLKLKPEGLGEIHVLMSCRDEKVSFEILTDNPMTKKLIESQFGELKAALVSKNFEVSDFNVNMKQEFAKHVGGEFMFDGRNNNNSQNSQNSQHGQSGQNGRQTIFGLYEDVQSRESGPAYDYPQPGFITGRLNSWA